MSSAPEKVVNIPSSSKHPLKVRFVTAASLFDGHDAAINIMRRILQSSGAEVIHLGHNRSVAEIVDAAIQEDAHAIALSSYQGGHVEYLKYMVDMLRDRKRPDMRVFAGGGGVIVPAEIRELEAYGVTRIYSPEDGQAMGLQGLIEDMLERCRYDPGEQAPTSLEPLAEHDTSALASLITALENDAVAESLLTQIRQQAGTRPVPVLGITGTGGSGKSSLTDEIIRRFRLDHADRLRIAIVAVDPTRRRTGGSLLGDRIRMNAINHSNIYMRSIATRSRHCRNPRHRTGRRRHRAAGRRLALRHDARIRRPEPARENRHARLRRRSCDQQVRSQGRRRRLPRCLQTGPAQP
jgi:methylmalonyl-CoA mutase